MVFIIKPIDIVSHHNGKRYTSTRQYERDLHKDGCDVMSDKQYRETREQLLDAERSAPKKAPDPVNHVHIDFNNGRIEKSYKKEYETNLVKGE